MGGAMPLPADWTNRLAIARNEVDLLRKALAIVTEQRDAAQRQLEAAMKAGFSLAAELVTPTPAPEAAIFRAIRHSR